MNDEYEKYNHYKYIILGVEDGWITITDDCLRLYTDAINFMIQWAIKHGDKYYEVCQDEN